MRLSSRAALLLLAAVLAGACQSDGPQGLRAGEFSLQLQSPSAGDRAIMFDLVGAAQTITPSLQSARVMVDTLAPDSVRIAIVAPSGSSIGPGEVARLGVANLCALSGYRARLVDVAGSDYSLKSLSGYALSVTVTDRAC